MQNLEDRSPLSPAMSPQIIVHLQKANSATLWGRGLGWPDEKILHFCHLPPRGEVGRGSGRVDRSFAFRQQLAIRE